MPVLETQVEAIDFPPALPVVVDLPRESFTGRLVPYVL